MEQQSQMFKNFRKLKKIDIFFFTTFILIVFLPILAPILDVIGLNFLAKPIYFVYSFTCHQFHTRSIHIFDHQYAWCARDTGIWFGFWMGSILFKLGYLKKIHFLWLIIFTIPIALDGGIQTISTMIKLGDDGSLVGDTAYVSNNLTRFITGSFFGLGLALVLVPNIIKSTNKLNFKIPQIYKIFSTMVLFLLVYIFLIFLWNITSSKYEPTNFLDSEAKVQRDNFFERRRNGACPTIGQEDILGLECFFE